MNAETSRERAYAAERLQAGTSYPIMQAARFFGVDLAYAYLIYDSAKDGMAGYEPLTSRRWRAWAAREAHEANRAGAMDFFWWACAHLSQKRRSGVLARMGVEGV